MGTNPRMIGGMGRSRMTCSIGMSKNRALECKSDMHWQVLGEHTLMGAAFEVAGGRKSKLTINFPNRTMQPHAALAADSLFEPPDLRNARHRIEPVQYRPGIVLLFTSAFMQIVIFFIDKMMPNEITFLCC